MSGFRFALAAACALGASPAMAGQFRFVSFDLGGTSYVSGLNDAGQVVGSRGPQNLPFIWTNGSYATVPPGPNGAYPYAEAISDKGVVVGVLPDGYNGPDPNDDYYRYDPRTQRVVTVPATVLGPNSPWLVGVDNAGLAVGNVPVMSGPIVPVIFFGRTEAVQGFPCGEYVAEFTAINASGTIAGYCDGTSPVVGAFTQKGSVVTPIMTQYYATYPSFVDRSGGVGGQVWPSSSSAGNGFVYKDGTAKLYDDPDYTDNAVVGTGPKGEVIGSSSQLRDGFWIYYHGRYASVHLPFFAQAQSLQVVAVNAAGTIIGNYADQGLHGFAAVCDADQFPCTR